MSSVYGTDPRIIGLIGSGYTAPYKAGVLDVSSGSINNWEFTGQFVGVRHT